MNHIAIIIAAVSSFMLGGLWYSPVLFGKLWLKESGVDPQQGHPGKIFGLSFVFCLIAAYGFAWMLGTAPTLEYALTRGAVVGLALVATSFGVNYQFSQRSTAHLLVDAGYHAVQFVLYGLIFGLWS